MSQQQNPKIIINDFVRQLISESPDNACSLIAHVYNEIVPSEKRFQIALDVVLPCMISGLDYTVRIAASYVLYNLYAPYPIDINPFKSALVERFLTEQTLAITESQDNGPASNENFVWVLWKILRGEGVDLGSHSPRTLLSSSLPSNLRSSLLSIDNSYLDPFGINTFSSPYSNDRASETSYFLPSSRSSMGTHENQDQSQLYYPYNVDIGAYGISQASGHQSVRSDDELSRAVSLLVSARTRVLTLSEQRLLKPHLPNLASPLPVLKAPDLPALITHNPTIAHPLLVYLVVGDPVQWAEYLSVIMSLPPTLSSFDFIGRLLRDDTLIQANGVKIAFTDLVRIDALGGFLHSCVEFIEQEESIARASGDGHLDDSLEKAVLNLCRFYSSLIKLSLVDPDSDAETAEMAHFALQHSRLEEANALYRCLAPGRL